MEGDPRQYPASVETGNALEPAHTQTETGLVHESVRATTGAAAAAISSTSVRQFQGPHCYY
jgi:hypothetical protein